MEIEVKSRDYMYDHIKAFLIFSVVIAHFYRANYGFSLDSVGGVIYLISFSYIMQGFLFVSGYFSQNLNKSRDKAFETFLFPYLILMPIMYGIRLLVFGNANLDFTLPTMALWYLLTLFFYRFMLKDLVKIPFVLPLSIFVSIFAGFLDFLDVSLSSGRTFGFLPFFLLGYYFKKDWIKKIRKLHKSIPIITLVILLFLSVYLAYYEPITLEAFYYKTSYAATGLGYLEGAVCRVLLSILALAWIFVMVALAPSGKSMFVTIGQNTMAVYVLHIVVRYLIKGNQQLFGQEPIPMISIALIAIFAVWLFSRPVIANAYQGFIDVLYKIIIRKPLTLIRRLI